MKLFIEYEISIVNKNMKILDIFHKVEYIGTAKMLQLYSTVIISNL